MTLHIWSSTCVEVMLDFLKSLVPNFPLSYRSWDNIGQQHVSFCENEGTIRPFSTRTSDELQKMLRKDFKAYLLTLGHYTESWGIYLSV